MRLGAWALAALAALACWVGTPAGAQQAGSAASADWAQAVALTDAGRPDAAAALLDRLVSAEPDNPSYRLELARALLAIGQRDRARFHLVQARSARGMTAADRARLDRLLQRLDGGKGYEAWVRLAIVPESNPGQRMDGDSLLIGGLEFRLNPGTAPRADTGLHLAFGGALLPRLGDTGLRLRLGASVDARLFRQPALNDVILRGDLGLQATGPAGGVRALGLYALHRKTGGATLGRALGLRAEWAQPVGQTAQFRLRAETEHWRHPVLTAQDGRRLGVSATWVQAPRPDVLLRASLFAQRTDARAPWNAGESAGLTLGVQKLFAGGLMLGLDLTHVRSRRDAADPLFGRVRQDRRTSLTARVLHRAVSLQGFAPVLELGIDRQRSTLALHSFRNARVSFGLSREF